MLDTNEIIVYTAIKEYILSNKIPPTVREICDITGFKSTSTIQKYIQTLEIKGYIKKNKAMARSITLE